jgi:hypothetical protein
MTKELVLYIQENTQCGTPDEQTDWRAFLTKGTHNRSEYHFVGTRRNARHQSLPDLLLTFENKGALMSFIAEAVCVSSSLTFALLLMDAAGHDKSFWQYETASRAAEELFAYDHEEFEQSRVSDLLDVLSGTRAHL